MSAVSYYLARLVLNVVAITAFYFLTKWVKVEFSWKLYWSAFAVYVILSLGDAALKQYWPEMFQSR